VIYHTSLPLLMRAQLTKSCVCQCLSYWSQVRLMIQQEETWYILVQWC